MKQFSCKRFYIAIVVFLSILNHRAMARGGDEFVALFNGRDLANWDGDAAFWSVEDGAITGRTTPEHPTKKNTFIIWNGGRVRDFELRVRFKITAGNSGVQYRSADQGEHVVAGYQADIVAGEPDKYTGILYEERGRGILAERGQKVVINQQGKKESVGRTGDPDQIVKAIRPGDWNEYVITARGNHIVQSINGHTTVDVTDEESAKSAREGILALQIHAGPPMTVQFKDIRLRELKDEPKPSAP
jgi:hypothetical protein